MNDLLLRNVRIWPREPGGPASDVEIRGGRIVAVHPHAPGTEPAGDLGSLPVADGRNGILLPALADVHAHLDSTRLGLPFRPHTAGATLASLIDNDRANWRTAEESVAERATRTLGLTIASGATTVRSHVQIDTQTGLDRLDGVLAARQAHAERATVEIVAFPQAGIIRDPGTAELLDAALRSGADLIGGIDPCGYDRDPVEHLDVVFGLAERHGVGIDIHLHDEGELGAFTIELIAERTAALSMQGRVTIGHAFAIPTVDHRRQAQLIELIAGCDIALATVAPAPPQALPLAELRAAGIRVGLGQDGTRDYWSPYGNGDVLERCWQLAFAVWMRHDADIEACVDLAARGGRSVVSGRPWSRLPITEDDVDGLAVGAPAELVVVNADTVTASVMDHPPRTLVIHGGRIVAADGELR